MPASDDVDFDFPRLESSGLPHSHIKGSCVGFLAGSPSGRSRLDSDNLHLWHFGWSVATTGSIVVGGARGVDDVTEVSYAFAAQTCPRPRASAVGDG